MINNQTDKLKVHIRTYGCQMNKYDSELLAGILTGSGFQLTAEREDADVLLINTCGVREHAENRALSDVDNMLAWKRRRPGRVVGMLGCLSRLVGQELLEKRPDLDILIGPDAYRLLPDLLRSAFSSKPGKGVQLAVQSDETYGDIAPLREPSVRAWVAVSRGCDNNCSYCMVPMARGPVRNRPVEEIINEVEKAVADGYAEVMLLGQNVNAYRVNGISFGGLLRKVSEVPGLKRVRFMTSHPKDLSDDLIETLAQSAVICSDLHLPVQSGSDSVLERMNRHYTRSDYLKLVEKLYARVPEIAISTDAIVGFPSENEEDFGQTLSLFQEVGYASGFVFRYSPRPGTASYNWDDDVSDRIKTERLMKLNETLENSRLKLYNSYIGEELSVLIEGSARKYPDQVTGRSSQGFVVAMPRNNLKPGEIVPVIVEDIRGFTFLGRTVRKEAKGTQLCG